MHPLLALLLACTSEPTPPAPVEPAPVAEPAPAPAPVAARPAGKIGGEPILPHPTVVGALSADQVNAVIGAKMDAINACYTATKKGKMLVKFAISKDGSVKNAETRSTSLRHEPTETCVTDIVAKATFPALPDGDLALVHYPFAFPPQ